MMSDTKTILIGYIDGCGSSGIDTYLFQVTDCLLRNGYRVEFLTFEMNEVLQEMSLKTGIKVYGISGLKHPIKQYRQMRRIFNNKKYDAAYFNISEAFNMIGILAANKCGISKLIVHCHSTGCSGKTKSIKKLRTIIHTFCKNVVLRKLSAERLACSMEAAKWMYDANTIKNGTFSIINNAIDAEKYYFNKNVRDKVRKDLGLEGKFVLGHVSGFSRAKNVGFLIDIMSEAVKMDPDVYLVLVGKGKDYEAVREKIIALGLEEQVKLLGRRKDVNELLQAFDAFVLPSFFEGAPIVAIEAQVSGLMVYLSDTITSEMKLSEKCNYISLEKTPYEWAEIILSKKSYDRSVSDFSQTEYCFDIKKQEKELLQIFN